MELETATEAEFDTFLSAYGYTVAGDKDQLLALSFAFLSTLDFCADEGDTVPGQCFIAYAISEEGGGFDLVSTVDDKTLTKKGLGRGAMVKEYAINAELAGTDSVAMLRRMPMAYGSLRSLLCQSSISNVSNFEIFR